MVEREVERGGDIGSGSGKRKVDKYRSGIRDLRYCEDKQAINEADKLDHNMISASSL